MMVKKNDSFMVNSPSLENIHYLFIFHESGVCRFAKRFTDKFSNVDIHLSSGFFSAIRSYSKEVIGQQLTDIGMGNVKIIIFKKSFFHYALLCEKIENQDFLEAIVSNIDKELMQFIKENKFFTDVKYINDADLENQIEEIITKAFSIGFDISKEEGLIKEITKLTSFNEILGILLLSDNGKLIYSSLANKQDIGIFLKEREFRVKLCNNNILKLYYTSKYNNSVIFSELVDNYLIILIFKPVEIRISEFYLKKAVDIIKKYGADGFK